MKRILSNWSKSIKHAMIDRDMDFNDIALRFNWTPQYVSALINGRIYFIEPVRRLSIFFNVAIPPENSTLAVERKENNA
ncbi:MAG: XRE family transcriptional regulator [Lachnospiraceae bacterium]|nr:XRE family transcriptional regulator [Lachnospiraceae bacterium]